jgi:ABC-type dipeptide/oligopeptide/nickel transport system permease component
MLMQNGHLARQVITATLISVITIVAVSLVPTLTAVENGERIIFSALGLRRSMENLNLAIASGSLNKFYMGRTPRFLTEEISRYAVNSAAFVLPAVALATVVSYLSTPLRRLAATRMPSFLQFLAIIPVFVVATLLQVIALKVNGVVGRSVITLAYLGGVSMPVLLPAFSMLLPIGAYTVRAAEAQARTTAETDFIRAARGRAIPEPQLWFRHVGAAILDRLEQLLPKTVATAIGTLFIAERIFNLPGLTALLVVFPYERRLYRYPRIPVETVLADGTIETTLQYGGSAYAIDVQIQVVVGSALAIAALYVVAVLVGRLIIGAIRRLIQ